MNHRARLIFLSALMAAVAVGAGGVGMWMVYSTHLEDEREAESEAPE